MSRRLTGSIIAAAVLFALVAHVTGAHASEWQPPVEGGVMLLGFGAAYPAGTHRGVDISATAGAAVASPATGVVAFAGQVPADGGGTCGAVTVELADGRRMSLLPLDGMTVTTGDAVSAGDALGRVAASGDDSSSEAHLHVGLRSGDLYLDPGELIAVVGPVSAERARSGARRIARPGADGSGGRWRSGHRVCASSRASTGSYRRVRAGSFCGTADDHRVGTSRRRRPAGGAQRRRPRCATRACRKPPPWSRTSSRHGARSSARRGSRRAERHWRSAGARGGRCSRRVGASAPSGSRSRGLKAKPQGVRGLG